MPWRGGTGNPLAPENLVGGSNLLADKCVFTKSLQIAIEGAIHPFGYNSLKDLASIKTEEKLPSADSLLNLQKTTTSCKRCLLYEQLLREMAEVLLSEMKECQMSPSSPAEANALASSIERLRGVVEVLECSPHQSVPGSPALFSAADIPSRARLPPVADLALSATSSLSQGSTFITSTSDTLNGSTGTWFYDLLVPNTMSLDDENRFQRGKGESKGKEGGDSVSASRSLSASSNTSGSSHFRPPTDLGTSPILDNSLSNIKRTTYLPRGASYSLSTFASVEGPSPPLVKLTDRTVLGRNGGKRMVNDYVVLRKIGVGSNGNVVLVQHAETKELYAMKVLKFDKKLNERQLKIIRSEIAVLKKVSHPNVVRLHEVIGDRHHKRIFLILQYISGGSISRGVSTATIVPIPEAQLRLYTKQILSAMKCLHSHGIFHRDIKPDNILIDNNEKIYLTDFGVCAISTGAGVPGVEGTPAFMAPEVCSGKLKVVGELVDVWALGVTLYQLMYGFLPFRSSSCLDLTRKIVNHPVVFPDEPEKQRSVGSVSTLMTYVRRLSRSAEVKRTKEKEYEQEEELQGEEVKEVTEEEDVEEEEEEEEAYDDYDDDDDDENNVFKHCKIVSSWQFKELIRGVLCKDPKLRWTLRRIGKSAWLNQEPCYFRGPPISDTRPNLAMNSSLSRNKLRELGASGKKEEFSFKLNPTPVIQSGLRRRSVVISSMEITHVGNSVESHPVLSAHSIEPPGSLPIQSTSTTVTKASKGKKSWKRFLPFFWRHGKNT
ncbi:Protein kinase domain [Trypanosoma melophagium]|uniref:Protein kinase domain n=1 Tax=Trypanosoma melophagium TaxID=715481 RepID=UPI00351AA002|nr:Protein kinase domain [Trypanosoma melophagium]